MSEANLEIIWITIIVLSCVSAWTAQGILFRKIKKNYYHKWLEIGEPGWKTALSFDSSKFKKGLLTLKYFFKGDSILDSDYGVRKLKNITKLVYLAILILIIIFGFVVTIFEYPSI